jgi:hypothetical protein
VYDCPAGRYGASAGLSSPLCSGLCRSGYYCPVGSVRSNQVLPQTFPYFLTSLAGTVSKRKDGKQRGAHECGVRRALPKPAQVRRPLNAFLFWIVVEGKQ